jgi:hypothetical protein
MRPATSCLCWEGPRPAKTPLYVSQTVLNTLSQSISRSCAGKTHLFKCDGLVRKQAPEDVVLLMCSTKQACVWSSLGETKQTKQFRVVHGTDQQLYAKPQTKKPPGHASYATMFWPVNAHIGAKTTFLQGVLHIVQCVVRAPMRHWY